MEQACFGPAARVGCLSAPGNGPPRGMAALADTVHKWDTVGETEPGLQAPWQIKPFALKPFSYWPVGG